MQTEIEFDGTSHQLAKLKTNEVDIMLTTLSFETLLNISPRLLMELARVVNGPQLFVKNEIEAISILGLYKSMDIRQRTIIDPFAALTGENAIAKYGPKFGFKVIEIQ